MNREKYAGTIEELLEVNNDHFVEGSTKRVIFGPEHFWKEQVMRCFTLKPKAFGKPHVHPWPHHIFIYRGQGVFKVENVDYPVREGSWVYVPEGALHSFWNSSDTEQLIFLCIVPPHGDVDPLTRNKTEY